MAEQAGVADQAPGGPRLPPFYRQPALLDRRRHGDLRLAAGGFEHARGSISVFVNATEFAAAARSFPIVFVAGETPAPVAILGLAEGRNLFVGDDGHWVRTAYVPAYVRRYPFILAAAGREEAQRLGLCIDEACPWIGRERGEPLFRDGKQTEIVDRALKLCVAFHREHRATGVFTRALAERDLLVPYRADLTLPGGRKLAVGGFQVIDRARFDALDGETFLDWRRRGWLPAVYAHLMSMAQWQALAERAAG
jgi:hypothetical protein